MFSSWKCQVSSTFSSPIEILMWFSSFVLLMWYNTLIDFLIWSQSYTCGINLSWSLYSSAQAVITKYHRLGDLNNTNVFSHSSGSMKWGCKQAWPSSGEVSLPGLQWPIIPLCPYMEEEREIHLFLVTFHYKQKESSHSFNI